MPTGDMWGPGIPTRDVPARRWAKADRPYRPVSLPRRLGLLFLFWVAGMIILIVTSLVVIAIVSVALHHPTG